MPKAVAVPARLTVHGPITQPCAAALQKVCQELGITQDVCLLWDDGSPMGRIAMFSSFLAGQKAGQPGRPIICEGAPGASDDLCTDHGTEVFPILRFPLDVASLVALSGSPPPLAHNVEDAVSQSLGTALVQYRKSSIVFSAHESAAKPFWQGSCCPYQPGRPLRATVLLVDDRLGHQAPPYPQYQNAVVAKFCDLGFEVFGVTSLPDLKMGHVFGLTCGRGAPESDRSKHLEFPDIDLVLLDIVEETAVGRDLSGIKRDLRWLKSERSVLPFPQVYMWSHLKRELAAHICCAAGADYYLEKEEVLEDAPFPLPIILRHTMTVPGGTDTTAFDDTMFRVYQESGWTLKRLPGVVADTEQLRSLCTLAHSLYSRDYQVRRVRMVKKLRGGFTGAYILRVRPEDCAGRQYDRVLKVADLGEMANELRAYEKYIAPYVRQGFARVQGHKVTEGSKAAISLEYVGHADQGPPAEPLADVFHRPDWQVVDTAIYRVYEHLHTLHSLGEPNATRCPESDIWIYFRRELAGHKVDASSFLEGKERFEILHARNVATPKNGSALLGRSVTKPVTLDHLRTWLVTQPAHLGPEWLVRSGKAFSASLPDANENAMPFVTVSKLMEDISLGNMVRGKPASKRLQKLRDHVLLKLKESPLDTYIVQLASDGIKRKGDSEPWGVVHGDLHADNIFVGDAGIWMIDFGKTRPGPPAIDFVLLEVDMRMRHLVPMLGSSLRSRMKKPGDWCDAMIALVHTFEDSLEGIASRSERRSYSVIGAPGIKRVERARRAILRIRGLAWGDCYRNAHRSYWLVLFLYLIRVVQCYRNEAETKFGPVGTLWAAMLAERVYERHLVPTV